jgi:hypothetical protein
MDLSIDPGRTGGAVFIKDDKPFKYCLFPYYLAFFNLVQEHKYEIKNIVIENVRGYAGENVKSVFTFGKELGKIEGILLANDLSLDKGIRVEPRTWVSFYKDVFTCKTKKKSCKAVKKLFGFDDIARYDSLSDAYLIWFYCKKTKALL